MKNIVYLLAFIIILSVSSFRCSKDAEPPASGPTKTDLIASASWKLEDVGFDNNKDGTIDITAMSAVLACQADNTLSFKTNNTGVTDEGSQKCNASDPQTSSFNWSFADAEANINVSNSILNQINGKSKVVVLSTTNLTLSRDTTISGLGSGWLVVKLKH